MNNKEFDSETIYKVMNGVLYECRPMTQNEVSVLLNQTLKKEVKQYTKFCVVCKQGVQRNLNTFGSCECVFHLKCCNKNGKDYIPACPSCTVPFNEKTKAQIQQFQMNMKKAQQNKQTKFQTQKEQKDFQRHQQAAQQAVSRQFQGPSVPQVPSGIQGVPSGGLQLPRTSHNFKQASSDNESFESLAQTLSGM